MTADVDDLSEERARWLMADLLMWHEREAKPEWWMYFERRDRYDEIDFVNDAETLGGLILIGEVDRIDRSVVWQYRFDPAQDYKFSEGDRVLDPRTERWNANRPDGTPKIQGPGTVHAIDSTAGTIDIKRGASSTAPHPMSLMPREPISNSEIRLSLQRVAEALLTHGTNGPGPARSARRLLGRHRPCFAPALPVGTALRDPSIDLLENATELIASLDESILAVQGPPGTGKTYTSARVILQLVESGRRVAICAFTHSAIRNLITACIAAADEVGRTLSIVQKVTTIEQAVTHDWVTATTNNAAVDAGIADVDIIAGTVWLFAREQMADCADVIIVDEAGQLSLANVVAIAPAARSMVLVGDPQQLAQPSKVTHPDGAGVSALEHILDGRATIDDTGGLLLDETRRLHPDICRFISEQFYDGRLTSHASCAGQRLTAGDFVEDAGLKFLPVAHSGNRTSSIEEARVISELISGLLRGTWVDETGSNRPITLEDILVVTPYNAQVAELSRHLPTGSRIGTVDKFQGRQAAVTIISMASSSAADAPRGMEFLFSRNRLNVAVSRAKVMAILVANPELPVARCNSIDQMRLVNALCRYTELAETIG